MSRVSHLSAGAICSLLSHAMCCGESWSSEFRGGELAMLGITPTRSATILAATLCILWEVTQDCHTGDLLAAGGYAAARQKKHIKPKLDQYNELRRNVGHYCIGL